MKKQLYSLQGIIFQNNLAFGTAEKESIGTVATIKQVVNYAMFYSIVAPDDNNVNTHSGAMSDQWGYSAITNFEISDTRISFDKNYDGRPVIKYSFFEKKENIWYGTYNGEDCGEGTAKLIVTPVEESLFIPPFAQ